jgi:hypothetical protein
MKRETGAFEYSNNACAAPATVSKCGFANMPLDKTGKAANQDLQARRPACEPRWKYRGVTVLAGLACLLAPFRISVYGRFYQFKLLSQTRRE